MWHIHFEIQFTLFTGKVSTSIIAQCQSPPSTENRRIPITAQKSLQKDSCLQILLSDSVLRTCNVHMAVLTTWFKASNYVKLMVV